MKRKAEDETFDSPNCATHTCILYRWRQDAESLSIQTPESCAEESLSDGVAEKLYRPINNWQTRVLFLEPGIYGQPLQAILKTVDLLHDSGALIHGTDEHVEYSALSYCWGEPKLRCILECNGETVPVTTAAYGSATASTIGAWCPCHLD